MKSEKITVSLPAETIQIANEKFAAFGFKNRSEFINAAIREYVRRDILRQFSGELAQLYLLLASAIELPYVTDRSLRGKAMIGFWKETLTDESDKAIRQI